MYVCCTTVVVEYYCSGNGTNPTHRSTGHLIQCTTIFPLLRRRTLPILVSPPAKSTLPHSDARHSVHPVGAQLSQPARHPRRCFYRSPFEAGSATSSSILSPTMCLRLKRHPPLSLCCVALNLRTKMCEPTRCADRVQTAFRRCDIDPPYMVCKGCHVCGLYSVVATATALLLAGGHYRLLLPLPPPRFPPFLSCCFAPFSSPRGEV